MPPDFTITAFEKWPAGQRGIPNSLPFLNHPNKILKDWDDAFSGF
jgi:hypothetical protein